MRERGAFLLVSLGLGVIGMALLVVGYLVEPRHALFSYLTAYSYVLSLALGSLVLLFIGHVTGARWFVVMRRAPEAVVAVFPLLAVLALPLLLTLPELYPWVKPIAALPPHEVKLILEKDAYLNVPFFWVRTALCFALWIVTAELLRAWSRRQDTSADGALSWRQRALSAGALPPFAFALTFWTFDWLMSLTPTWYSNALGFYFFTGCFVGGIALLVVIGERARFLLTLARDAEASLFHTAGKLLLVSCVLWAYIAFSQFFLMWIADIPEEVHWYLPRTRGEWGVFAIVVAVVHFALPFFALLSKPLKRRPRPLAFVAAWLLVAHFLDLYWVVFPTLHPAGLTFDWTTPAALLGIGGLCAAFAALRAGRLDVVPRRDPLLRAGMEYRTR